MKISNSIRIFVGADRSQWLATRVLDYSIRQHTSLPVDIRSMAELDLPRPRSRANQPRTGFSFARFAIPALAGYEGRALYLDADMLVLRDIAELWDWPMAGRKVQIQGDRQGDESDANNDVKGGAKDKKRPKQCAVMLLDCAALDWDVDRIVAGLDGQYDYQDLMGQLCILQPGEIGYGIPFRWNSLEHYDATTGLIHYTDMLRQPWVSLDNPNRGSWIGMVRTMLAAGAVSRANIRREIGLGYARPSLLLELEEPQLDDAALRAIDRAAGFVPHAAFTAQLRPSLFARIKRRLFG